MPCPHAAGQTVHLFHARDYISGDRFEIVRCLACGIAFTWPRPTLWDRYYPAGYYGAGEGSRFMGPVERMQDALYAGRATRIERMADGRPGRVLDVGCGRGFLLRQFQRRGWEVLGTELSAGAAAFPRDALGLPVEIGELIDLRLPAERFDAVVLWHVLEHVAEPNSVLAEVARVLRPGGVALVAVPNFGSWEARLCRDRWFHLDVPRHLSHFTVESLGAALAGAGLATEQFSFFAPEYDFFSFVQSALNRFGLRHNLLYNLLRSGGAKVMEGSRLQALATVSLAAPLGLASLAAAPLAAVLDQGATISAWARKRS